MTIVESDRAIRTGALLRDSRGRTGWLVSRDLVWTREHPILGMLILQGTGGLCVPVPLNELREATQ